MENFFSGNLIDKYEKQYKENPRSRVFAPLAEGYRKLGLVQKAINILQQGIRYNPEYHLGYLGLASCYYDLKKYEQTYSLLRPIVSQNRDNIRLQSLFGDTCIKLEYYHEALETYKYLLYINPRDPEIAALVKEVEGSLGENVIIEQQKTFNGNNVQKVQGEPKLKEKELSTELSLDNWQFLELKKEKSPAKREVFSKEQSQWKILLQEPEQKDEVVIEESGKSEDRELFDSIDKQVVTHTLVDLYCSQGHFDKAIKILEKIQELNPEDQKTLLKLKSLKAGAKQVDSGPRAQASQLKQTRLLKVKKLKKFCIAVKNHADAKTPHKSVP